MEVHSLPCQPRSLFYPNEDYPTSLALRGSALLRDRLQMAAEGARHTPRVWGDLLQRGAEEELLGARRVVRPAKAR